MAAESAVAATGLIVLNFALASLVLRVHPLRLPNLAAGILFALNGGAQAVYLAVASGATSFAALGFLLDAATLAPLLVLALVAPWPRLRPAIILAVGAVLGAFTLLVSVWSGIIGGLETAPGIIAEGYGIVFIGIPLVGTLLLLDAYLGASTHTQREQARFLLAAFAMKTAGLAASNNVVDLTILPGRSVFAGVAILVVSLTVPLSLIPGRLTSLRGTNGPRTVANDAFVLGALVLGFIIPGLGVTTGVEYLLVRPILFAYAILRFQLVDVDIRARRGSLMAASVAATVTLFVVSEGALRGQGVEVGVAVGLALLGALGVTLLVAWPLVVTLATRAGSPSTDPRAREVYLAALEQSLLDSRAGTTQAGVLRVLRERFAISEREHAVMEASARVELGRDGDLAPGRGGLVLGRHRVTRVLGEGSFGRTVLARDETVSRDVVLKIARFEGESEAARLLREARILARFDHNNVVRVYDVERVGRDIILVLEYVEGGSLAAKLESGPLSINASLAIFDDVVAALGHAHAEGVIHRDVKPANILLTPTGAAKLADFGIARASGSGSGTISGFTMEGSRGAGSLRYMAPEQVRGTDVDGRADLYAAGVVLYECLAGRPYLDLQDRADFDARLAIIEEPPLLPLARVPGTVNALLAALLAKDRSERPRDAAEVRRRITLVRARDAHER